MLNWVIDVSLRNRLLVLLGAVAFAAAGGFALAHLDIDAFPDTTPVQVQINTTAPALGPEEAETLWTCEIAWKAGYLESTFRAMAGPPGSGRRKSIGESPSLRWTLMTDPEPPTSEMIASVKALVSALVAAGWERTGTGTAWYAQRFIWRGDGEPRAVTVPGEIETAQ